MVPWIPAAAVGAFAAFRILPTRPGVVDPEARPIGVVGFE
jgi:hypothetical protein